MRSEVEKGVVELAMFKEFVKNAPLELRNNVVVKNDPIPDPDQRIPDIYCELIEGPVYFELTEACCENSVKAIKKANKTGETQTFWGNDVSEDTVRKKLNKSYTVSEPIELLIYTNGRTILPDDVIINRLQPILESRGLGCFRRAWFFGKKVKMLASTTD
ncbi:MAG: hypothetical protein K9M17_06400 [Mariprofundaceae bacterium]|nr:hypothetical protein [Mariprofundaceae bacterium]